LYGDKYSRQIFPSSRAFEVIKKRISREHYRCTSMIESSKTHGQSLQSGLKMKFLSPFRSTFTNNSTQQDQPRLRDFNESSDRESPAHRRRPRRTSTRYGEEDTRMYTNPSDQFSSRSDTNALSQYKLSEIVNPDGTVTVRNLVIKDDGSWECQEEDRDCHQTLELPFTSKSCSTIHSEKNSAAHSQSYITTKSPSFFSFEQASEMVPDLALVVSFESSRSSTSSETSKTRKSLPDAIELSEAAAHKLRRQRLAKANTVAEPLPSLTARKDDYQERSSTSHRSLTSTESSWMMMLTYSPDVPARTSPPPATANAKHLPENPSETRRTTAPYTDKQQKKDSLTTNKQVVFQEGSLSEETTEGAGSIGYLGQLFPQTPSIDAEDDESSVFQNVVASSPDGNRTIDEILGPPPAPSFFFPNASNFEHAISDAIKSKNRTAGNKKKDKGVGQRFPRDNRSDKMSASTCPSVTTHENNKTTGDTPLFHTVTVHKVSREDKIGLFVGLKKFSYGKRLVVSRVAPFGKFSNSGVDVGDIVVSINGRSMVERPSSQEAFGMLGEFFLWINLFPNPFSLLLFR
jgi:hypothetical protein